MSQKMNQKDRMQLSAYLDERLSSAEKTRLDARIASDPEYQRLLQELTYTRKILRSLPQKRAPRNFTLSPEKVKIRAKRIWFQPALSFVSIASTALLVVLFASPLLFSGARSAAPMLAQAPEAAMDSLAQSLEKAAEPMIILWNPVGQSGGGGDQAYGMGGGGEPAIGIGGGPAPIPTEAPLLAAPLAPQETPSPSNSQRDSSDPSTLILGLPGADQAGQEVVSQSSPAEPSRSQPNPRTITLISLASLALVSGAAAIFLRRQ